MASLSYAYQSGGQMWVKAEAGTFAETAWTLSVVGLPAGATVNSVRLSFYLGYTYTTPSLTSVRVGDSVVWSKAQAEQGNYSADLTGWITGNGSYSLVFKNTAKSGSRSYAVFSQVTVVIDYTNPVSEFSLNQASVDAGSAVTVNIARVDSGYTHRVTFSLGNQTQTVSGVGTSLTYTIPLGWVDQLPSALSGTGMVTVETMNGTTSMGTRSCSLTVTVPESVVPSPGSLTAAAVNGYWGLYVQGYSQCSLVGSGYAPGLGASISSVYLSGNGDGVWADSMTSSLLRTAGEVTFTLTVRDSRGRAASTTAKISVTAYSPVAITGKVAYRCGTDGTEDRENGRCARLGVSYAMTAIGQNAATVQVWYRESGGGWAEIAGWSNQNGAESVTLENALALDKRYEIRFLVSDAITQAEQTAVIAPGAVFMVWNKKRRAFGFGEYPAGEKQFVIGGGWSLVVNGLDAGQTLGRLDTGVQGARKANLLDNSDFTNTINQRGQTIYSTAGQYTFDRWVMGADVGGMVAVGDGYIGMNASSGYVDIEQIFEHAGSMTGKAYTLAVMLNGASTPCLMNFTFGTNTSVSFNNGIDGGLIHYNGDRIIIRVSNTGSSWVSFLWAALYEGTYTADTLPNYAPKGYAVELAECQRYYQQWYKVFGEAVGNVAREALHLAPPMRIAPTVTYTVNYSGTGSEAVTVNSANAGSVDVTYTGYGNVTIALSADL